MFENIAILAGGESKRFWPLSNKHLMSFNEKPLLIHQLDSVNIFAKKIYVVVNKNSAEATKKVLRDFKKNSAQIIVQTDTEQLNAVYALKDVIEDEIVIMNCSGVFDVKQVLQKYLEKKTSNKVLLAAKEMDTYYPGGYMVFIDGKVSGIVEKPDPNNLPSNLARFVCDYIADFPSFVQEIETITDRGQDGAYEKALSAYISHVTADVIRYTDFRYTLKYCWNVLGMSEYFLKQITDYRSEECHISPNAIIDGPVYIGNNVRIMGHAHIKGPVYIGNDSVIGDFSLVRESMIGKGVQVGAHSEVVRSYLANGVNIHRSYVGDSVLGENVHFGAGTITANVRFDKALPARIAHQVTHHPYKIGAAIGINTHTGIHTSLMPGVTIAPNSQILPGSVVSRDIHTS